MANAVLSRQLRKGERGLNPQRGTDREEEEYGGSALSLWDSLPELTKTASSLNTSWSRVFLQELGSLLKSERTKTATGETAILLPLLKNSRNSRSKASWYLLAMRPDLIQALASDLRTKHKSENMRCWAVQIKLGPEVNLKIDFKFFLCFV